MAKTESVLDIIGAQMDQRPAPLMYVGPTKDFLHDEFEPRLTDMLNCTKSLRDRLAKGKAMSKYRKVVGGVPIRLVWAGSAASLRGMAAKTVLVDELDAMPADIQGNGDPFSLTESRGFSFADRFRGAISTPLLGAVDTERDEDSGLEFWRRMSSEDVTSPIWRLFQSGTMHHWSWPCPHCAEFFIPRFKQLRFDEEGTPAQAKRDAFVECPTCGGVIDETHKAEMNARGRYVAPGQRVDKDGNVVGPLPDVTMLSYWVSGLASPMVTFGDRAAAYLAAKLSGKQTDIQSVINTGFGECFAPGGGDVPEWQEVAALKRPYKKRQVPPGVRIITLAVDVQKNGLYFTIRGWGAGGSSWGIDAGFLVGPTTEQPVWDDLANLLTTPIGDMVIHKAFIDSGFRPGKPLNLPVNKVYEFCRRFPRRCYPTKGKATQDKPLILGKNDVNAKGEVKKYGLDLIWLDTDYCKSWVHERIRWESDKSGAWLLPDDTTDDFCKQIVSEARVQKPTGKPEWVARSRNNHYLDCEGLQAGLGHLLNVHLMRDEPGTPRPPSSSSRTRPATPESTPKLPEKLRAQAETPPASNTATQVAASARRDERRKRLDDLLARRYGGR